MFSDDNGKPWVLPSIKSAEEKLVKEGWNGVFQKEYAGLVFFPTSHKPCGLRVGPRSAALRLASLISSLPDSCASASCRVFLCDLPQSGVA